MKNCPKLLEDRDPGVRESGKQLILEMVSWLGRAPVRPHLQSLKPVQLQELDTEFDKIEAQATKPTPTRFTLTEQKKRAAAGVTDTGGGEADTVVATRVEEGVEVQEKPIDAWELADPVEIVSKFPSNWQELLSSKKWQERKEALEPIEKLVSGAIRLKTGEYGDLCHALINVIKKDANIVVVQLAAKIIAGLATALRRGFSPYAYACLEACLERSKEKKQTVVQAFREACDAIIPSTSLESMADHVVPFLNNKTPQVKSETAAFIDRCFVASRGPRLNGNKKIVKLYIGPLLTLVGDQSPDVREAAFETLGSLHAFAGEKVVEPNLADIDPIRLTKIHEVSQKKLQANKSSNNAPAPVEPATTSAPKPVTRPSTAPKSIRQEPTDSSAPVPAVKKVAPKSAPAKRKPAVESKSKTMFEEPELSDDAAIAECCNLFGGEEFIKQLQSSNWKERKEACEMIQTQIQGMAPENVPVQAIIRTLATKSGLKENNLPVMKLKLELVATLSSGSLGARFSRASAHACLNEIIDKIGDVKYGSTVQKLLTDLADSSEAVSPEFLVPYVLTQAMNSKSPKTHQETMNWVATVINDFGLRFSLKETVPLMRQALGSANGQVRSAAIASFGQLFLHTGKTLRTLLDDEKPALLQLIDAEFERVKDQPVPKPTKGIRATSNNEEDGVGGDENDATDGPADELALEDLIPRVDISGKLSGELMEQLDDKTAYKVRKEAIDRVLEIIKESKMIEPNLGELPPLLVKRMKEANKVLVQSGLSVCDALAAALGRKISDHTGVLCPAILNCFGDSKVHIRQQAVQVLSKWVEQCGGKLNPFFDQQLFSTALQAGNPILRTELFGWLSKTLPPTSCRLPKDDLVASLPLLLASLEDRSGEVRKAANEALLPVMIHTGFEPFSKAVNSMKPASRDQLMPLLDKARAELPAAPVRTATQPSMGSRSSTITKKPASAKASVRTAPEKSSPPASSAPVKAKSPLQRGKTQSSAVLSTSSPASSIDDSGPVGFFDEKTSVPAAKDARSREESKLKLLKWNFSQPSKEYVEQLRKQTTTANFSKDCIEMMFSTDVKQHIRVMDQIANIAERKPIVVYSNIDLLFKWLTLRFFENNTTLHIKCFRLLLTILPYFATAKLRLSDSDVSCFFPYLLLKIGDPKDNIRRDVHAIIQAMTDVYPVHKLFHWIVEGFKSRNAKQRAECLDQIQTFFNDMDMPSVGVDHSTLVSILRSIASQVADRDASVRNAALSCLVVAATRQGFGAEGILQHAANSMAAKERAMLEERLKRTCQGMEDQAPMKQSAQMGTPQMSASGPSMSGTATMTRPSRGANTPSLDSRGSTAVSTPNMAGYQQSMSGTQTITRRNSASRPVPRVDNTPQLHQSPAKASPSPLRNSEPAPLKQAAPRFEDPYGQNWAPPTLPQPLPAFTAADEFLAMPPLKNPTRNVDPNTLPATAQLVPSILARMTNAETTLPDISPALNHILLTASYRRCNLEPHCDAVISTLTSLLRRICDTLGPGSVPDLYRTEAQYYKVLAMIISNLEDLHARLFQPKSPFAQAISLRVLKEHISLLTMQLASFSIFIASANEQRKNNPDSVATDSHYESHFSAQQDLQKRLIAILKFVVKSANMGTLLVVLIELLQECVQRQSVTGETPQNTNTKELVLKALWNITRHIEERHGEIGGSSGCNWESIVGAAHRFFVAFPPSFWTTHDSVPARTVRTVFNAAIVNLGLGKHILNCYEKISPDNYSESQFYAWLLSKLLFIYLFIYLL